VGRVKGSRVDTRGTKDLGGKGSNLNSESASARLEAPGIVGVPRKWRKVFPASGVSSRRVEVRKIAVEYFFLARFPRVHRIWMEWATPVLGINTNSFNRTLHEDSGERLEEHGTDCD